MEPTQNLICHAWTVYEGLNDQVLPDSILQGPYPAEMEQANAMPKAKSSRVQIPISVDQMNMQSGSANAMPIANSSRVPIPLFVGQMNTPLASGSANAMRKTSVRKRPAPYRSTFQDNNGTLKMKLPSSVVRENRLMASSSDSSDCEITSEENLYGNSFLEKINSTKSLDLQDLGVNIGITFRGHENNELFKILVLKTSGQKDTEFTIWIGTVKNKLDYECLRHLTNKTTGMARNLFKSLMVKLDAQTKNDQIQISNFEGNTFSCYFNRIPEKQADQPFRLSLLPEEEIIFVFPSAMLPEEISIDNIGNWATFGSQTRKYVGEVPREDYLFRNTEKSLEFLVAKVKGKYFTFVRTSENPNTFFKFNLKESDRKKIDELIKNFSNPQQQQPSSYSQVQQHLQRHRQPLQWQQHF
eukprot:GHVP01036423.1.p1 GENE.GHVP01036423.1~~GHVP01036423.1.p1  ORF type:complete len:413 (-),score=50.46 GHVP01036423.1:28-1266(-)